MEALAHAIPGDQRAIARRIVEVGCRIAAFLGLANGEPQHRQKTLLLDAACGACSEVATLLVECRSAVDVDLVDDLRARVLRIAFGISSLIDGEARPRNGHLRNGRYPGARYLEHPRTGRYGSARTAEQPRLGPYRRAQ